MDELSRAPIVSSRQEFEHIFGLHKAQPWTAAKQDELFSLMAECEDQEEFKLVLELLHRYENFDEIRSNAALNDLHSHVVADWSLSPNDSLVVAMHKDTSPGSAQAMLQMFKPKFAASNWNDDNFVVHLAPTFDKLKSGMRVVFIDDFIGTGNQFGKSLDWYKAELAKRSIANISYYLVSLCIMQQAVPLLESKGVSHYAASYMKKGLEGHHEGPDLRLRYQAMARLEAKLHWKDQKQQARYRLGFRQSEALFRHMNMNAPNNNFPVFWWPRKAGGNGRKTLQDRF